MIHPDDLANLAELYDRYANAIERLSPDRLLARRQFFARLETLHAREGAGVDFEAFRHEMVKRCKEYLMKN
jgi:hypothetical protein